MAGADHPDSTMDDRRQDDEYDMDLAMIGVADGFRPLGVSVVGATRNEQVATSHADAPGSKISPSARPSSIMKPKPNLTDSLALRHDGAMGPVGRMDSPTSADDPAPVMDVPVVRAESPYQGPAGPSHPYQMYPQESRLARADSLATTSTFAVPERSYNGPGPIHPYGLYPQNTSSERETATSISPVRVGFLGVNNIYQRRIGPDGEEIADIIGPDGHTEQLPPYTKYPEEEAFARKPHANPSSSGAASASASASASTVAAAAATPASTSASTTASASSSGPLAGAGAGGIGLATRNPEFSSQEDLNTSRSHQSTPSFETEESKHQANMAAMTVAENERLNRWQRVAKRNLCGIVPLWAIFLTIFSFFMFGIILATVLTLLKPKHNGHNRHNGTNAESQSNPTIPIMLDASPLTSAPLSLPTLPTGTYALPISAPSAIQNTCIRSTTSIMSSAWSCSVPVCSYSITVSIVPGSTSSLNNMEIDLSLGNASSDAYYAYGTQPPILSQTQVLSLVTDNQDPDRGPAWFFQLPYNKLVIVPEKLISQIVQKRENNLGSASGNGEPPSPNPIEYARKRTAGPGDKPWFCYWNGTILEAFIYANLTSNAARPPVPNAPISPTTQLSATTTTEPNIPIPAPQSSDLSASVPVQSVPFAHAYPKVLKMEERRISTGSQSIAPYCIQQVIDTNGIATPLVDHSTGQLNVVYLNETESSNVSQKSRRDKRTTYELEQAPEKRFSKLNNRESSSSCSCEWLWT